MTITINVETFRTTMRGLLSVHQHPYIAALMSQIEDPAHGGERLIAGTIGALVMDNARLAAELQRMKEREAPPPVIVTHVES